MTLFVADVSSAQRGLSMATLKAAGMSAVIIKCTEAAGYVNPYFSGWLDEAQGLKMPCAAYHFLHPTSQVSAARQAANIDRADPDPTVPVWMDCEAGATRADGYAVADALRALGQTVAGIYHGARPQPGYGGWWRAAYLRDPSGPAAAVYARQGGDSAASWVGEDLWQFCQHGTIPGYRGDIDFSAFRGTLDQLESSGWFWTPNTPTIPQGDEMRLHKASDGTIWAVGDTVRVFAKPDDAEGQAAAAAWSTWTGLPLAPVNPQFLTRMPTGAPSVDVQALAQAIVAALPAAPGVPSADQIAARTADLLSQRLTA